MKQLLALVSSASLLIGMAAFAGPANSASSEDEASIRKVIVQMTEAFNRHDAKAATAMYTRDADFVSVRGVYGRGVDEIEKTLAAIFATTDRKATLKTLKVTVRFIKPDVAIARVTNELSGLLSPEGEMMPPHRELSIRVFIKEGAEWRVAAFQNTRLATQGAN